VRALRHEHKPEDWQLFIDSSKLNLKAVLLQGGHDIQSVGHVVHMNVSQANMTVLLI
jgi:hypothetical protein